MEEFRPVIVDSVVLTMLNKRILTINDFVSELGAYRLKDERRKVFLTQFEERLNEEIEHRLFGYKTSYRRCLELQARLHSLFECFLTRKELILLQAKLAEHLVDKEDSVRFYPLCANCVDKVETVGGPPPSED